MQADVIVVGGGHAGCEAAYAAARLGAKVAMFTLRRDRIAHMSCNPAIGGVAKGHVVREIDALGGLMARAIDATGIQFRRLNASRGPAVRSSRAQADSSRYRQFVREEIESCTNITIVEDEVLALLVENGRLVGVRGASVGSVFAGAVILTTGTFLSGKCFVGDETFEGGRVGDAAAKGLSTSLREIGLTLGRFKTGTTPRLDTASIHWDALEPQSGDIPRPCFSFDPVRNDLPQIQCFLTYTNEKTDAIVRENLDRSPLYRGIIEGTGPRYCPSLEDKVVRFADRKRHQIFLEPEGLDTERVYPNGISTSLPKDVQDRFLHSIVGLEDVRILEYGYAVEYDYAPPTQLLPSLMTKVLPGLFLAGQINGTSGYEEAAGQGLMAGLNAVRWMAGDSPAILGRHEAYIGVLIDDLVTKGVDEPYRLFTSRAEYRLILRESNAEERLWRHAMAWGLLPEDRIARASMRDTARVELKDRLSMQRADPAMLARLGLTGRMVPGSTLESLLRRPEITLGHLFDGIDDEIALVVEESVKYAGYIEREAREIVRMSELDNYRLPDALDYLAMNGLSNEVRSKLLAVQPITLGQASRIPGVTPTSLALLRVLAHRVVSRETSEGIPELKECST